MQSGVTSTIDRSLSLSDLSPVQRVAEGLWEGESSIKKAPRGRLFFTDEPSQALMPRLFSVSRMSRVVLMTVSELRDMLLMPHSTRNRANSG